MTCILKSIPLLTLALGLAFAASAQTPKAAQVQSDPAPGVAPAAKTDAAADADQRADAADDLASRNCLKHTGSRIAPRADKQGRKCVSANGRSYSKEDLDRTGEIDLADALRRLDPAVH